MDEERFTALLYLVAKLRSPDGCPWDRSQTKEDMARYLLEETYEVVEAVEKDSWENLKEELGDLLFQVIFLARLAEEAGRFSMGDVLAAIREKMIRRHPHVFGGPRVDSEKEVRLNWERIKSEVEGKSCPSLAIDIPKGMPTLARAQLITTRAAAAGFDWPDLDGVLMKMAEETEEFKKAAGDQKQVLAEAGDLLLTVVNLCRHARVDAETALRLSLKKFLSRFAYVENGLAKNGKSLSDSSLGEMDDLWDKAKDDEKGRR